MRKLPKILAAGAACAMTAALILGAAGCTGVTARAYDMYGIFGTQSAVVVYADYGDGGQSADAAVAAAEIEAVFTEIDAATGLYHATSDVARFNAADAGEELEIGKITYDLLTRAEELYEYTGGAYDPAVGLLVDLWGFTPRFNETGYEPVRPYDRAERETLPDEKYIEAFRGLTGFGDVTLTAREGRYFVTKPARTAEVDDEVYTMNIDLGGIGKGYAADRAREILTAHGLTDAYVNVGTSSLALLSNYQDADGAPAKNMWSVSLAHPRGGAPYLKVYARNVAASTSGDYEHAYTAGGVSYCHIIDPQTGRPIQNGTATVSLFGRTAADGDALTTALCVMGRDKAIEFVNEKLTDCRVAMVCRTDGGGYGFITNMDEKYYQLSGGDFPVVARAANGRITYVG